MNAGRLCLRVRCLWPPTLDDDEDPPPFSRVVLFRLPVPTVPGLPGIIAGAAFWSSWRNLLKYGIPVVSVIVFDTSGSGRGGGRDRDSIGGSV